MPPEARLSESALKDVRKREGGVSSDAVQPIRGPRDDRFDLLRTILIGPEAEQLRRLRNRLDDPELRAEETSAIMAEAIALSVSRDARIRKALQPVMEDGFRISVQRNPQIVADTLYPVIGPSVRKALTAGLHGMMESLNATLQQSFSLRGLKWRLEAWRTGKTFGEIVLLRSLDYRVEQVFLIHQKTGLLLQHIVAREAVIHDADLVSGMLTAIQDFVHDSFGSFSTDELMQVGDFNVRIQHGPKAFLACVIRGVPPIQIKIVFQTALEKIHREMSAELDDFEGDNDPFARSRQYLESCLMGQRPPEAKVRFPYFWAGFVVVLLLICAWVAWSIRQRNRWNGYLETLSGAPGIVVTSAGSHWGNYFVSGLRDPLAADPAQDLAGVGLSSSKVSFHWQPFLSADPKFTAIRDYESWKDRVEQQGVMFALSKADVSTQQAWNATVQIRSLLSAASKAGRNVTIEITGFTDPTGPEMLNSKLGPARADAVADELVNHGVPRERLITHGGGVPFDRRASFRVIENAQ